MSALGAALVVTGWLVLPGLAIASLIERRERTPEQFAVTALAAGLSVWLLGAEALATAGGTTGPASVAIAVVLTAGSVIVLAGPGRSALRALRTGDTASLAAWMAVGLAGFAPVAARLLAAGRSFVNPTPWYYWDLVRQTVAAHGVVEHSTEWATRVPFLADYPAFTSGTAVLAAVTGDGNLTAARAVELIAGLSAGLGVFLLIRMLGGSRGGAAVGTLLFFAMDVFTAKLLSLRPEALGYGLGLLVGALALRYLRERRPAVLALVAVTFVALGQVHGIVWTFSGALLAAAVVSTWPSRADARRWLLAGGLMTVVVGVAYFVGNALLHGGLSGAAKLSSVPEIEDGIDPTWRFVTLIQNLGDAAPPSITTLLETSLRRGIAGAGWPWMAATAAAAVATLIVVAVASRTPRRGLARRGLCYLVTVVVVTAVVCQAFAIGWETYVPRRTGYARLVLIGLMLVPVALGLAIGLLPMGRRRAAERAGSVVVVLALVAVVFAIVHGQPALDVVEDQQPKEATVAALDALDLPDDALVLANAYTESIIPVLTGAPGVIDGRAPYTEAELLRHANALLVSSRDFFAQPLVQGLPCREITHVLVATEPWALATNAIFPTDHAALDLRPDLRVVAREPGYVLYEVTAPPDDAPVCAEVGA